MSTTSDNNKRIAKNTLYLYIRKIIGIIIAFYSSRLLLQALGINDFGLYGLVGSIVALFSSLRSLFSSAIQRFINIAKGRDDGETIKRIFCIGVKIHFYISILFFIVVEIAGLILIPQLNIAPELIGSAQWVLQFSILATIVTIMTVPYDALIIANEKFNIYATFAIVESCLKFGIIFLLYTTSTYRVVLYSALLFVVSLLVRFLNMYYCLRTFGEVARYHNVKDKQLFKEMTKFAGWQLFGNTGYAISSSGLNFILNIFGGTIANAARTIAYQVMGIVTQFMNDISVSFQPRAMIKYAEEDYNGFQQLLIICSKATFVICVILSFPIIVFTPAILTVWLNEVPEYSIIFVRLIMVYLIIRSFHGTFDIIFKTSGILKPYQICDFTIMILNLPVSWCLLSIGFGTSSVFITMTVLEFINLIIIMIISRRITGFNLKLYITDILIPAIFSLSAISIIGWLSTIFISLPQTFFSTLIICIIYLIVGAFLTVPIMFKRKELTYLIKLFRK